MGCCTYIFCCCLASISKNIVKMTVQYEKNTNRIRDAKLDKIQGVLPR